MQPARHTAPEEGPAGVTERHAEAARTPAGTTGNAVHALIDGRAYLSALAEALGGASQGDLVMLAGYRVDAGRLLDDGGPTLEEALVAAIQRGALVRGLVWRSHLSWIVGTLRENRRLVRQVNRAGGEMLLDHRVRPLGSHHQKFVAVRHRLDQSRDVAFVGGVDLALARRDDPAHEGDPQSRPFAMAYGPRPAWHDVQLELRGPVVAEVERTFRERWDDPQPMTRLPWHRVPDRLYGLPRRTTPLPAPLAPPPAVGSCRVQLLRTYPARHPGYPFAPRGELGVARGLAQALDRARRLVYVEDQYLWSAEIARLFARALRGNPELQVVSIAPPRPDQEGLVDVPPQLLGQAVARRIIREAGHGRVHRFDLETEDGWPIYVHSKVTLVDDEWAAVGSSNLNRRSWTHDSELTAAMADEQFARDLRLRLMGEHLGRETGDDADLLDPAEAVRVLRASADALDAWHRSGCHGPRPRGRLRTHVPPPESMWRRRMVPVVYDLVVDPDGRPLESRWRRARDGRRRDRARGEMAPR